MRVLNAPLGLLTGFLGSHKGKGRSEWGHGSENLKKTKRANHRYLSDDFRVSRKPSRGFHRWVLLKPMIQLFS